MTIYNTIAVLLSPIYAIFALANFPVPALQYIQFSKNVYNVKTMLRVFSFTFLMLRRNKRAQSYQYLYRQLILLDNAYFEKYNHKQVWNITHVMLAISISFHILIISSVVQWFYKLSWGSMAFSIVLMIADHMELLTLYFFSRGMWNLRARVDILNKNLNCMVEHNKTEYLAVKLWQLASIHNKLNAIYKQTTLSFSNEIFALKAVIFVNIVGKAFFISYAIFHGFSITFHSLTLASGCLATCFSLAYHFAFDFNCEKTGTAFENTQQLLNYMLWNTDIYLMRASNTFALRLQIQNPHVQICNNFKINRQLSFCTFLEILNYSIILVQNDYIMLSFIK